MGLDVGSVKGALELTNTWSSTLQAAAADQKTFEATAQTSLAGVSVSADKAGASFEGLTVATGRLRDENGRFIGGASGLKTGLDGVAVSAEQFTGAVGKSGASVNLLGTAVEGLKNPVGTAQGLLSGAAESMGGIAIAGAAAVAGVVAVGTAMFKLATDAASVGATLDDLADKTGLSVPALSRLSNATQVIGADMGQLTDVVFKLQRGIGENTEAFQTGLGKMGLSTAELRAAGPDRYLELITAGLKGIVDPSERAAAGNAVLGRGYKDVAAALNDLDAGFKATADLTPWTTEQAARAEAFEQQIASLETHVKAAGIAIGTELIPAASLLVTGIERIGVAVVNVTGLPGYIALFNALKGAMGETELAEASLLASMDTANRLFAEQGATSTTVAEKMLALGYSVETVTMHTGLGADAVTRLNTALKNSQTAAENYAAVWDRVNGLLSIGAPTIDGVSLSTKGLVVDMLAAGVSLTDVAAATGLSLGQLTLLGKAEEERGAAVKKAVAEELAAKKALYAEVAKLESSAHALSMAWVKELNEAQAKANLDQMKDTVASINTTSGLVREANTMRLALYTSDSEMKIVKTHQWFDDEVAKLSASDENYRAHYDALLDLESLKIAAIEDAAAEASVVVEQVTTKATAAATQGFVGATQAAGVFMQTIKGMVEDPALSGYFGDTGQGSAARTLYGSGHNGYTADEAAYAASGGVILGPVGLANRRAMGGPVTAGESYLVGDRADRQPEIFTPGANGFITPMGGGGSLHVQVTVNGGLIDRTTARALVDIVDTELTDRASRRRWGV